MANYTQLDSQNIVINVVAVNNAVTTINGNENEQLGIDFLHTIFGVDTIWKQTSYNAKRRKNYANIGYSYDPIHDAFIPPQPYPSWTLNQSTFKWDCPVAFPQDSGTGNPPKMYGWDETTKTWINTNISNQPTPIQSAT